MLATEFSDNMQSIALIIMAVTGGSFLLAVAWKGRSFVAKYKQLELTLNPEKLQEFSVKMDEVVKSVNNKAPEEPTLFATVKLHTHQLSSMQRQLSQVNGKLDELVKDLRTQVGLRVTTPETPKEESHAQSHSSDT